MQLSVYGVHQHADGRRITIQDKERRRKVEKEIRRRREDKKRRRISRGEG